MQSDVTAVQMIAVNKGTRVSRPEDSIARRLGERSSFGPSGLASRPSSAVRQPARGAQRPHSRRRHRATNDVADRKIRPTSAWCSRLQPVPAPDRSTPLHGPGVGQEAAAREAEGIARLREASEDPGQADKIRASSPVPKQSVASPCPVHEPAHHAVRRANSAIETGNVKEVRDVMMSSRSA